MTGAFFLLRVGRFESWVAGDWNLGWLEIGKREDAEYGDPREIPTNSNLGWLKIRISAGWRFESWLGGDWNLGWEEIGILVGRRLESRLGVIFLMRENLGWLE